MKSFIRNILSLAAVAVIASFSAGSAFGQDAKVVGEKPQFDDLPSPEFPGGGKQKDFKPKHWLEIETKLRIDMAPEPKSKTCESLTVKWYIAVKNPEKAGTMLLLTKSIEHVNVPLGEDIYCSVYLSPASIRRVAGFEKGKRAVEYVGYEVYIDGVKKYVETNKGPAEWWNKPSNKIARTDTVPLLSKAETPFSSMWWDRYAEVATPGK